MDTDKASRDKNEAFAHGARTGAGITVGVIVGFVALLVLTSIIAVRWAVVYGIPWKLAKGDYPTLFGKHVKRREFNAYVNKNYKKLKEHAESLYTDDQTMDTRFAVLSKVIAYGAMSEFIYKYRDEWLMGEDGYKHFAMKQYISRATYDEKMMQLSRLGDAPELYTSQSILTHLLNEEGCISFGLSACLD